MNNLPSASVIAKHLGPLSPAEWHLLSLLRGDGPGKFSVVVVRSSAGWTVSQSDRETADIPSMGKGDNFDTAWNAAQGFVHIARRPRH